MPDERPSDAAFHGAAKAKHHKEGSVEIDDDALVSVGDDPGAYVQAWIWVEDSEAQAWVEAEMG